MAVLHPLTVVSFHPPSRLSFRRCGPFCLLVLFILIALAPEAEAASKEKPAQIKVSGTGLLSNRRLAKLIRLLASGEWKNPTVRASAIEDSALILLAQVEEEGYLKATLEVDLILADGSQHHVSWAGSIEPPLPRQLTARSVRFRIHQGVRYHYRQIQFRGLTALTEKKALGFFIETGVSLPLPSTRVFTPARLRRSLGNVAEALERLGYENASATAVDLQRDERAGTVQVTVEVHEGARTIVQRAHIETFIEQTNQAQRSEIRNFNHPYSRLWMQDFTQSLKATNYHQGYPDATVHVELTRQPTPSNQLAMEIRARVETGPRVRVGSVLLMGQERTRESVMRRRLPLKPGDWMDPVRAEEGRTRLARLGVFDTVQLRYEPAAPQRNVIYEVKEKKAFEANLLFGYGSYELLRGGFELEQRNLFGLAHQARLQAIQSFKSTHGEFTYTMPELLAENVDVFVNGFALRREEVSFTREEYGGGVGVHRFFPSAASDVSVRYNRQVLNTTQFDPSLADVGVLNPGVGAIITDLRHDRRDNPLYPRRGYKIFGTLEVASEYLAGDVNYQRFEGAASYHQTLGGGRTLSFGINHGFATTPGDVQDNLPFVRRFFPGGEYSIRGYQDGQAAPRNAEGQIIGAETYLLGTIELEQSLTRQWSIVGFSDSIGFASKISDYPMDETLYSVGGGIRWRTVVGPVRLEYGHNLNPRPRDPSGTLHFSLGFPF